MTCVTARRGVQAPRSLQRETPANLPLLAVYMGVSSPHSWLAGSGVDVRVPADVALGVQEDDMRRGPTSRRRGTSRGGREMPHNQKTQNTGLRTRLEGAKRENQKKKTSKKQKVKEKKSKETPSEWWYHVLGGSWVKKRSKEKQKEKQKRKKESRPYVQGGKKAWSARIVSPSGQKTTG